MSEVVRRACEHGRYEAHRPWQQWDEFCDPWGEGKNTIYLDRMVNLRPMKSKWIRWVSEWEPAE